MCIELKELSLKQGSTTVLANLNLHLHRGEKIGLIGPNGSGKTTLLKALAALKSPDSGSITLDCRCLNTITPQDMAREMAILLQEQPADLPLSVTETIELAAMARFRPGPELSELLELCHLDALARKPVSQLSGGERQRVFLAQALYQSPSVLLLDEPCNHLDVRHMWQLLKYCRDQVDTVIASYHDFNLAAAMCDRLILLADGGIRADGVPEEVLSPANLRKYFGVNSQRISDCDNTQWIQVTGAAA
ncbi:MAG: ABC transporter ATP-binding protein [Endozoicomonas sp.]